MIKLIKLVCASCGGPVKLDQASGYICEYCGQMVNFGSPQTVYPLDAEMLAMITLECHRYTAVAIDAVRSDVDLAHQIDDTLVLELCVSHLR